MDQDSNSDWDSLPPNQEDFKHGNLHILRMILDFLLTIFIVIRIKNFDFFLS